MRIKGSERSSILLLSRNTVVIGIVIIAVTGFGLGYFLGYRGGGVSKEDIAAREREMLPPENRRVLEPPGSDKIAVEDKPVIMLPPISLPSGDSVPGETLVVPSPDRELLPKYKDVEKDETLTVESEKKLKPKAAINESIKKDKTSDKTSGKTSGKISDRAISGRDKRDPKARTATPADKASPQRLYAIQIGAFPSREGAERLQRILKTKGVESYIVNATRDRYFRVKTGSFKNRRDAERNAAILEKKTGMKNFVTTR